MNCLRQANGFCPSTYITAVGNSMLLLLKITAGRAFLIAFQEGRTKAVTDIKFYLLTIQLWSDKAVGFLMKSFDHQLSNKASSLNLYLCCWYWPICLVNDICCKYLIGDRVLRTGNYFKPWTRVIRNGLVSGMKQFIIIKSKRLQWWRSMSCRYMVGTLPKLSDNHAINNTEGH